MAYFEPVTPADSDDVVVEALRCYCANRRAHLAILPSMLAFAERRQFGAHAMIALTSVFELAEACLGRPLEAETDQDAPLSSDEQAMLMLLASVGDVGAYCGSAALPHGLPGTLAWAVRTANRLCGRRCIDMALSPSACPFDG
ncbi:hypothetical protein [Stakelama pacifica]|uniref:Uncharacterized protein n=1 Tax=Stakelama pacifica TaxID=517720 RepID=A0A4V3BUC0_9SPHN|nr:hypothetical protein [Stakelama pacifica]TDN86458.1 hypothetical protein EV664_10127 [Stakelama pacifica]GGO89703.1 hypothetical protein GCM10011329_00270 [Stakelama pacifica]